MENNGEGILPQIEKLTKDNFCYKLLTVEKLETVMKEIEEEYKRKVPTMVVITSTGTWRDGFFESHVKSSE